MLPSTKLTYFSSVSAPKKIGTRDKPIFDFSMKTLSPGISPSVYAIPNFVIESSKDVFFNASISISDLKYLGEVNMIIEEDHSPKTPRSGPERFNHWMSKSTSGTPNDPIKFHKEMQLLRRSLVVKGEDLFQETKPPGFDKPWHDYSSDSDFTPVTHKVPGESISQINLIRSVVTNEVLLKQPPKIGLVKRECRGKFNEEEVSYDRYTGKLKFYQLKKRFGFITLDEDNSDVFLCEDDLILSGINYKAFKECVFNKLPVAFEFNIKKYMEKDQEKRKAIDVIFRPVVSDSSTEGYIE